MAGVISPRTGIYMLKTRRKALPLNVELVGQNSNQVI